MRRRYLATLPALLALALGAAACGDDDEDEPTSTVPEISVPSGEPQTVPEQTTTEEQPTTTTPASGGTEAPSQNYDPSKPDSPQNDVPPEPGTPEAKFEQFCRENPGACG